MIFLYGIYALLSLFIGISDFLFYRIPNLLLGIFLGVMAVHLLLYENLSAVPNLLMCFAAVLALGFLLFHFRWLGAGDAKFLSVTSPWALMLKDLPLFLLAVSVSGAVMALLYLKWGFYFEMLREKSVSYLQQKNPNSFFQRFIREPESIVRDTMKQRQIMPYGVAISLGCLILIIIKLTHHEL